jgi:hypothetical protein
MTDNGSCYKSFAFQAFRALDRTDLLGIVRLLDPIRQRIAGRRWRTMLNMLKRSRR